jgi:hypothetical protein
VAQSVSAHAPAGSVKAIPSVILSTSAAHAHIDTT